MSKQLELVELATYAEVRPGLESCRVAEGRWHPVLSELSMTMFRGAQCWVVYQGDDIVHIHASKFGKRKKNKWEPYWNWYIAYTRPDLRRQGYAKKVSERIHAMAVEAGCVRMKSLAGTLGGLRLHMSRGDELWDLRPSGEVVVDTPLIEGDWRGIPPNATVERRMTQRAALAIKALKYDKEYQAP